MTLKGPYLRLVNNKPISWVIIDVTEGQPPKFYQKSLEEGATYQAFQINENEQIYAIVPTSEQKLMWTRMQDKHYEVQNSNLKDNVVSFQNTRAPLSGKNIQGLGQFKFSEITYVPTDAQKDYYQTDKLEEELQNAEKLVEHPESILELNAPKKDYSLDAVTKDMQLTPTQVVVLEKLELFWFFHTIDQQYISDACKLICGQNIENQQDVGVSLDNAHITLRQTFCWPENIVKSFNHDVMISEVINFTYTLVNKVYQLHTNGEELPRPKLPKCANQTVGEFLNPRQENPVDFDNLFSPEERALQPALFASFAPVHVGQNVANQGLQNIFQSSDYNALTIAVHCELYPPIQLSLIAKWCEWILNLCRILDIDCLRMSNVGKEITKHQAMSEDKKTEYNQKFFNSNGNFDDNIRDLYVYQLWKGR